MKKPDHHDADLLLKLYDLRREARLRQARDFVNSSEFNCKTFEELTKKFPEGSEKGTFVGMSVGYWDMVCVMVEKGLLNEELFFATTYEHLTVWEKIAPWIVQARRHWEAPQFCTALEQVATRHRAWMQRKSTAGSGRGRK